MSRVWSRHHHELRVLEVLTPLEMKCKIITPEVRPQRILVYFEPRDDLTCLVAGNVVLLHWGLTQHSPKSLSWIWGTTLKWRKERGKGRNREMNGRTATERTGENTPWEIIFWLRPYMPQTKCVVYYTPEQLRSFDKLLIPVSPVRQPCLQSRLFLEAFVCPSVRATTDKVQMRNWHSCNMWRAHSGPEVFFKTCVAVKFVDDDDDDDGKTCYVSWWTPYVIDVGDSWPWPLIFDLESILVFLYGCISIRHPFCER